jgi:hypothetical protein
VVGLVAGGGMFYRERLGTCDGHPDSRCARVSSTGRSARRRRTPSIVLCERAMVIDHTVTERSTTELFERSDVNATVRTSKLAGNARELERIGLGAAGARGITGDIAPPASSTGTDIGPTVRRHLTM